MAESPTAGAAEARGRRLDSWKEIAAYLQRDVTTVRRWEKREGLPVHRHHHAKLGSVYAFEHELEAWRAARRPVWEHAEQGAGERGRWRPRARLLVIALVAAATAALMVVGVTLGLRRPVPAGPVMLAVLPFENLDGDAEQDYFSDGLTDEMISRLSALQLDGLSVIARTSAMLYKRTNKRADQIGRELGVAYLLEGSVRRAGERVQLTARLIRAHDQSTVWSREYGGRVTDVLSLQKELASAVADEIRIKLSPQARARLASGRPVDRDAYELFLKGRYAWNQRTAEKLREAVAFFESAIARDPTYAPAHAGLADSYSLLSYYAGVPPREAFPLAKASAERALELDPELAEARTSLAYILHRFDWDWTGAEQGYRSALALNPGYSVAHHWYGELLVVRGRLAQARAELSEAAKLDPLSARISLDASLPDYFEGRYRQAAAVARRVLDLHPDFVQAHVVLREADEADNRYPEAIEELRRTAVALGRDPEPADELARAFTAHGAKGYWSKFRELAESGWPQPAGPAFLAGVQVALGDREKALTLYERAYAERDDELVWIGVDNWDRQLRADPRFIALLRDVGLQDVRQPSPAPAE